MRILSHFSASMRRCYWGLTITSVLNALAYYMAGYRARAAGCSKRAFTSDLSINKIAIRGNWNGCKTCTIIRRLTMKKSLGNLVSDWKDWKRDCLQLAPSIETQLKLLLNLLPLQNNRLWCCCPHWAPLRAAASNLADTYKINGPLDLLVLYV